MSALEAMHESPRIRWPRAKEMGASDTLVQPIWPSAASPARASSSTSPPSASLTLTSPEADWAHQRLTHRAASLRDTLKQLKSKRRKTPHEVAGSLDPLVVSLLSGGSSPEAFAEETSLYMSAISSLSATELGYSSSPAQIARPRQSVTPLSRPTLHPANIDTTARSAVLDVEATSTPEPRLRATEPPWTIETPSPSWHLSPSEPSCRSPEAPRNLPIEAIGSLREELKNEQSKWVDEFASMQGAMRGKVEDLTSEVRAAHIQWKDQLSAVQGSETRMVGLLGQCSQISINLRRTQESWCKQVSSAYEEARDAIDTCSRLSSQMDEARRAMSSEICVELDQAKCAMTQSEAECAQLKAEMVAAAAWHEETQRRMSGRLGSLRLQRHNSNLGPHADAALENVLAEHLTYLESRNSKSQVMLGTLEDSVSKGMASAQKAEAYAAEEMRILEEELKQHLREHLGAESRWREEASVARAEVESLRQTLAKLEFHKNFLPVHIRSIDGCAFGDLPEFMQQVAFAVAHFKLYPFKLELVWARSGHKARLLWEEWHWREHEYWEGASHRDFPFADLRSQDLTKISREAQEAYHAVVSRVGSGASDGSTIGESTHVDEVDHRACTFVKALARALHRFLRMPGAQDAGMAWIKTAVREAGILARAEESSRGGAARGSAAEEAELQDVMARAEMAMRLPPAQFLRRIREGFTPLSPLMTSSERFL